MRVKSSVYESRLRLIVNQRLEIIFNIYLKNFEYDR